jgi:hypothetical protein
MMMMMMMIVIVGKYFVKVGSGFGSCPRKDFGVNVVEPSGYDRRQLV